MWTYRLKYAKRGRIRFISHLDVMRALVRAMNRAEVPIAYSKGFNPRARMTMGPALPLGYESNCELADIYLARMMSPHWLHERLRPAMPEGLDLLDTEWTLQSSAPLSRATSACYMIQLSGRDLENEVDRLLSEFLAKESVAVERVRKNETKRIDAKQIIRDAAIERDEHSTWLRIELFLGNERTCSPSEAVAAIFKIPLQQAKCMRTIRTNIRFDGHSQKVKR